MPKQPRYTVALRRLSIDDLASLVIALDPKREPAIRRHYQVQARAWREIHREWKRCDRAHEAWRRRHYPKLYRGHGTRRGRAPEEGGLDKTR
jgi:hypothetical protein